MKQQELTVKDVLETLPRRMRSRRLGDWKAVFHFDIRGKRGGRFTVRVGGGACVVLEGLQGTPDCLVQAQDSVFLGIELGDINPQVAFLTRRVRVSNVPAMLQFGKVFYRYGQWRHMQAGIGEPLPGHRSERLPVDGPLSGIRILDFTRLYPGPLATMMMGELGAEVIKIEDPGSPDPMRGYPPYLDQQSVGFLAVNRFKYSLALNYRHPEGRRVFFRLLHHSDMVVESFRPGVMDEWGLGYGQAREAKADIIYLSLTGYGQQGPLAARASHDLNYLALSGLLSITGTAERPVIPGGQLADVAGGAYMAVIAALTALWHRERTGEGRHLDVAMLEGTLPLLTLQWAHLAATGKPAPRGEDILSGGMAAYNVYRCADGKFIALAAIEPKFWETFCDLVGHPEWKQSYFTLGDAQHALIRQVAGVIARHPREYWVKLGERHDICLTPVLDLQEVPSHPHIQQRHLMRREQAPPRIRMPFLRPSEVPGERPAPALGQDTVTVLEKAGFSRKEIQTLHKDRVVLQQRGDDGGTTGEG